MVLKPVAVVSLGLEFRLSGLNALEQLVVPAVEAAGYRFVRLRVKGGKAKTLQIMAERADGQMDVDDCARLSRAVSEVLDASDPIADEYTLEVSSPGIDRPLTRPDDFSRFAGHEARIEMVAGLGGRRRFKGVLIGRMGNDIVVDVSGEKGTERVHLPFSDLAEAKLALTDRLIAESLKARDLKSRDKT